MKMKSTTEYLIKTGLIELIGGKLSMTNLDVKDITVEEKSIIKVNEGAGIVDIIRSKFENITRTGTNGNGAVINAELSSNNRKISIKEDTTFSNCKVDSSTGLGGAIYLSIAEGAEDKFVLSGASYLTGNNAKYGKSLFINALFDL
jgi:hypothetical protein